MIDDIPKVIVDLGDRSTTRDPALRIRTGKCTVEVVADDVVEISIWFPANLSVSATSGLRIEIDEEW